MALDVDKKNIVTIGKVVYMDEIKSLFFVIRIGQSLNYFPI